MTVVVAADLHDPGFAVDPHPVWDRLRRHQPVFHDTVDDVWVVTRHGDVKAGFADTTRFSNRLYARTLGEVFGPTMLQMDGAEHIDRRKVVAPVFAPTRLDPYRDLVESAVAALLDEAAGDGTLDIVADLSARLPGAVIVSLMGLPDGDAGLFHDWYETMMRGLWADPELRRAGRAAHEELHAHIAPIVEQRRECPADDLLSRLVTRGVGDLPAFISLLLTAGGETTDKALSNLWHNLLCNPDQYDAVKSDHALVDRAFDETMRYSPSLVYNGRHVIADTEWHGTTIPAGARLRLAVAAANRDPDVFAEPGRFDLGRDDLHHGLEHRSAEYEDGPGHIGFGAGPHFCLGYALARLEATTATRMLLERYPRLRPAVADLPPIRVNGPSQSPEALPVVL